MRYKVKQIFERYTEPFVIEPDGYGSITFMLPVDRTSQTFIINGIDYSMPLIEFRFHPNVINDTVYRVTGTFNSVNVIRHYYSPLKQWQYDTKTIC